MGQREREVADMPLVPKSDFSKKLWTDPRSANERRPGPRSGRLACEALLPAQRSCPDSAAGECVFTTTGGAKPVNGFLEGRKTRIDKLSGVCGLGDPMTCGGTMEDAPFCATRPKTLSRETRDRSRTARPAQGLRPTRLPGREAPLPRALGEKG